MSEDIQKPDLTRQEVDAKLEASEAKVQARQADFDISVKAGFAETNGKIAELTGAMNQSTAELNGRIDKSFAELAGRIDKSHSELGGRIDNAVAELRAEMHKNTTGIVKWVVGMAFGMGVVGVAMMNFFLTHADKGTAAAPTAQPIIIYVQPPGVPPAVPPPASLAPTPGAR